jgi:3-keto-5-aminohexanoate cleavage enzyme
MDPPIITAALTGPIASKADNLDLPCSPEEIAEAARGAYEAGAAIVHVHLRDADERPTADIEIARRTVDLIHERCGAIIQLSTGVGLDVPFEEREKLVETKPRMATLNPCSMSFADGEFRNPPMGVRRLAARMRELGVKPEVEIYDTGHLDVCMELLAEDLIEEPLQFSIVLGVRGGMAASADNLVHLVGRLPAGCRWQVIGIGRSNLAMTAMGLAMGGNARTGMEDTLMLRRGEPARSNAQLVERLVAVARSIDRPPADPTEAESELGLTVAGIG